MVHRTNHPSGSIPVKLALQGGGAHGAFTWGALDRLLQVPGLIVESVCGTSSGAMNASALAQGWARNGAAGARETLDSFWLDMGKRNSAVDWWMASSRSLSDSFGWPMTMASAAHPLRPLVEEFFNFDVLRTGPVALHLVATRIRDSGLAIFSGSRLSADALIASASLPPWFPAVEIDGEAYWDGGFAGNPALEPLLDGGCDDVLCVMLQPLRRSLLPRSTKDAVALSAELAFGGAFIRELRDIAIARERATQRLWPSATERQLRRLRLHVMAPEESLATLGHSATDTRPHQLQTLHDHGYATAEHWLAEHGDALGRHGSFPLAKWLDSFERPLDT